MLGWLPLSFSLIPLNVFNILLPKMIEKYIVPESFTSYNLLLSGLFALCYLLYKKSPIEFIQLGMIAAICELLGKTGVNNAYNLSENSGIAAAVFRLQIVITTIGSIFLFNAPYSIKTIMCIISIVVGEFIIVYDPKVGIKNIDWLPYALMGAIFIGCKDLLIKRASMQNNFNADAFAVNLLLLGSIFGFILQYYKYKSLKPIKTKQKTPSKKQYVSDTVFSKIFLNSLVFFIYSVTIIYLIKVSPNPGYPKAIVSLSVLVASIFSKYKLNSSLKIHEIVGTIIVILGIMGLSLFS